MSERRERADEDAPKVDTEYGERAGSARSSSGIRNAGDARRDREAGRGTERASASRAGRDDDRGTSWVSVVLGLLAALGASLILSGILALLVPFIGGAIGGAWGARTGRNRP